MSDDLRDADQVADRLLPLDGPYDPDRVVEAARAVAELVRRLNHATFHASALRYPPQVDRTVGPLRSAVYGLEQTFNQVATRLDRLSTDPRVEHDTGGDPAAACTSAAQELRQAAAGLGAVTGPLDRAASVTFHLGYDTARRSPFRRPSDQSVPQGQLSSGQVRGPAGRSTRPRRPR